MPAGSPPSPSAGELPSSLSVAQGTSTPRAAPVAWGDPTCRPFPGVVAARWGRAPRRCSDIGRSLEGAFRAPRFLAPAFPSRHRRRRQPSRPAAPHGPWWGSAAPSERCAPRAALKVGERVQEAGNRPARSIGSWVGFGPPSLSLGGGIQCPLPGLRAPAPHGCPPLARRRPARPSASGAPLFPIELHDPDRVPVHQPPERWDVQPPAA